MLARIAFLCLCGFFLGACNTTPDSASERDALVADTRTALERFRSEDSSMSRFFDTASGYAVFPSIGKGGFGVGGAFGRGQLFEGGQPVGFASVKQASIGFQLGGQTFRQIIFFQNADALRLFKTGQFEVAAQVSAVIATAGAADAANYENGVVVFVASNGGAMYEASVGGQKFEFEPN